MFTKKRKTDQLEMILTGLIILNANMESHLKEIKRERVRIERLISELEQKCSNKTKVTYL